MGVGVGVRVGVGVGVDVLVGVVVGVGDGVAVSSGTVGDGVRVATGGSCVAVAGTGDVAVETVGALRVVQAVASNPTANHTLMC